MLVPEEIKEALSALDHNIRWRIIEMIEENSEMSYTGLLKKLAVQKGCLTYHLNRLMETGVLDNYSREEFNGPYSSFYQLSPFGKDLIAGLLSSVQFTPLPYRTERPSEPSTWDFRIYGARKHGEYVTIQEILARHEVAGTETPINPDFMRAQRIRSNLEQQYSLLPEQKRESKSNLRSLNMNE